MHTTRMNHINKVAIVTVIFLLSGMISYAETAKPTTGTADTSTVREVLVSQQMFVTDFAAGKRKMPKGKKDVNIKPSLQGVFKVVEMGKDSDHVLTDWIRCPDAGCPAMGTYTFGTPAYRKLDTMIAVSKKNTLNEQKRFARMVASKK